MDAAGKRRALICGISGQDGAYLAQFLLSKGYEVWGTSRNLGRLSGGGLDRLGILDRVKLITMSLADSSSVADAVAQCRPHEIYNLASQSSVGLSFELPHETLESGVLGVLNILHAILQEDRGIRFFNAGSGESFGNTGGVPADEGTPFQPESPYAVAKTAAAALVRVYRGSYGLFATTGFLFNHESPLRQPHFVSMKIVAAAQRIAAGSDERLRLGNMAIRRDWGWAEDYVEAMWLALAHSEPKDYVISTGVTQSLSDFVATVFEEAGLNWRDHVLSDPALFRPSDPAILVGEPGKAKRLLGWQAKVKGADVPKLLFRSMRDAV